MLLSILASSLVDVPYLILVLVEKGQFTTYA
jgi:hypothetical protein